MADLKMPDVNYCTFAGRLASDASTVLTASGKQVCNFRVAVSRKYKGSDGELHEDVAFLPCVAWDKTAEFVGRNCKKGAPVIIEGRIIQRTWEKDNGEKHSTLEVVASRVQTLAWNFDVSSKAEHVAVARAQEQAESAPVVEDVQDDIPF